MTADGAVFTWGRGKFGALGHGNYDDVKHPKQVDGLSNIVDVRCGTDYTVVKDIKGKLHAFGDNSYGQLGIN